MSDVVIRAEGLGKRYLIGHETERESYVALRDVMARSAQKLVRSAGDLLRGRQLLTGNEIEEFWALKDVNFEIRRGEVVGIIGRNGAGKSTLLKILSRITEPTTGRVEILGRVASLLEVGTGFHPELTGRENIFLNGAILGMSRAEIKRKFDEIVDFAEVEKFLDTPVKRYSSGMYVRLAFAVAAHLEPEILIVDEVLAVGDAEFQKKCLGKMKDVAGGGRTVLFVSHNMGAVQALCSATIFLQQSRLIAQGATSSVMSAYLESKSAEGGYGLSQRVAVGPDMHVEGVGVAPPSLPPGSDLELSIRLGVAVDADIREAAVLFYASNGVRAGIVDLRRSDVVPVSLKNGLYTIDVTIANLPLVEGAYSVGLYLVTNHFKGNLLDLVTFSVRPGGRTDGFIPYPSVARGFVEFAYRARIGEKSTLELANAPAR
jgi:lipopolysaccharide transport system ATP-binding protein